MHQIFLGALDHEINWMNWIKVYISTDELSRNNIFHIFQYLCDRLMKDSFKISKGIFTSKLKEITSWNLVCF